MGNTVWEAGNSEQTGRQTALMVLLLFGIDRLFEQIKWGC
jgi:hypothetical protein